MDGACHTMPVFSDLICLSSPTSKPGKNQPGTNRGYTPERIAKNNTCLRISPTN